MANTIRLKQGSGSDPSASDLVLGELAVRTDTGKIFLKKDNGSVAEVSGGGGVSDGDKGDITVSNTGDTWTIDADAAQVVNKMPKTGGTFTGDITIASGVTNKNIDIDVNGTNTLIRFDDGLKATFGDSDDLQIYHDGTEHKIDSSGGQPIHFRNTYGVTETLAKFTPNGSVQLCYDDNTKFETTSSGVSVTGTIGSTGGILNLGTADTASGHINSYEVMTFNVDTDNDDTNRYFAFYKNGSSGSGTELFKIEENGQATITGNLDVSSGVDVTGNITVTGTVDGRDLATDGSKLDTYEANGSSYARSDADDTITGAYTFSFNSATKLVLNGNDDSRIYFKENGTDRGYLGWDAGNDAYWLWNNQQGAGFYLTNTPKWYDGSGYGTMWHSRNDGSGSGLDADTVDGIEASYFVRTDISDTLAGGTYTIGNNSTDEKIVLTGSSNPYIRFHEGSTSKAYIQWNASGYLELRNQEDNGSLIIRDDIRFTTDGFSSTSYKVWHEGNDGSGSGLDADLLDGMQPSDSASNSTIVQRTSNGYIFCNYLHTTDNSVTSNVSGIMCKTSGGGDYHRTSNAAGVRSFLNVEDGANNVNTSNFMGKTGSYWNVNNWLQFSSTHGLYWPNNYSYHVYLSGSELLLRNNQNTNGIRLTTNSGTLRGMIYVNNSNEIGFLDESGNWALRTKRSGNLCTLFDQHFLSDTNATYDLGSSTSRWRNVYTSDLDLSNEAKGGNDVDGTWGSYTIQEGEESLFLINRRNGKKYKFNLTEVS